MFLAYMFLHLYNYFSRSCFCGNFTTLFLLAAYIFCSKKMKEEGIEYFYGNKLEIEKEKQRKRELMSYFPKMLGTIDKTKYVLCDNDRKKQEYITR